MAGKKYYYILVLTDGGPVFVTGIPERTWCSWEKDKKPMIFGSKHYADETAWELRMNGFQAYSTALNYELSGQPYRYDLGDFEWVWNKDKNKVDKGE